MLHLLPFLAWLGAIVSLVILVLLRIFGGVDRRSLLPLFGAFLVAAYAQFVSRSDLVNKVGLVLQTLLAVYLLVRIKLGR